jgi:hypothetical protein
LRSKKFYYILTSFHENVLELMHSLAVWNRLLSGLTDSFLKLSECYHSLWETKPASDVVMSGSRELSFLKGALGAKVRTG